MTRPSIATPYDMDDKIAGVVAIRSPWLRGPYLELLCVLPDFQRQRIGADVLQWMEQEVRPTNQKPLGRRLHLQFTCSQILQNSRL